MFIINVIFMFVNYIFLIYNFEDPPPPSIIKSACDQLNHNDPVKRIQKPLKIALNQLDEDEFTERVFVGVVNRIRLHHPHVTKAFHMLWLQLARHATRCSRW